MLTNVFTFIFKTAEHVIEILSLSDRPIILVFRHQDCCVNLTASPLTGRRIQGVAIFDQYAAISITNLETLESRRLHTDLVMCYKIVFRLINQSINQ